MADTIFILGAGASNQAGIPLMADFLDVAEKLMKSSEVESPESFEAVFRGISTLQQVHSKSQIDIVNIESVFSAFEMARTLGKLGNLTEEEINELPSAMRTVIVQTVQSTLKIPVRNRQIYSPRPYDDFADLIRKIRESKSPKQSVAVITFNYDMGIDLSLHFNRIPFAYGWETNLRQDIVPLLKLHGSLNWAQCSHCKSVIPWDLDNYFSKYQWPFIDDETTSVFLNMGSHIKEISPHCKEGPMLKESVIAPPTWSKAEYHMLFSKVWGYAAREMGDATNIFVIGYSLPETDMFFRYLYALGTAGNVPLKRFWVFDPSSAVGVRFEHLLGPGAIQRFQFHPITFEKAIGVIRSSVVDS